MASLSNIFIDQGSDFVSIVTVADVDGSPLNLTGYSGIAQIRKTYESLTALDFQVSFDSDRSSGQITISLSDEQTSLLEAGRYVYDVLIHDTVNDLKTRVVEGIATINPSVSRS